MQHDAAFAWSIHILARKQGLFDDVRARCGHHAAGAVLLQIVERQIERIAQVVVEIMLQANREQSIIFHRFAFEVETNKRMRSLVVLDFQPVRDLEELGRAVRKR